VYYLADPVPYQIGYHASRIPAGWDALPTADRNWLRCGDKALLWAREAIDDPGLVLIADDKVEHSAQSSRRAVEALVKDREFDDNVIFADMIAAIYMNAGETLKGKGLVSSKQRGRFELLFGPGAKQLVPFWSQPDPIKRPSTVTYTDNFTGDGNLNGRSLSASGTWSETSGTGWLTSGGVATFSMSGEQYNAAVASGNTDSDDMYAEATMSAFDESGGALYAGLYARCNSGLTSAIGISVGVESGLKASIYEVGGSTLDTDNFVDHLNKKLKVLVDGSSVEGYVADVLVMTGTGTISGSSNRKAGIDAYGYSGGTKTFSFDLFSYSDIGSAAPSFFPPFPQFQPSTHLRM